MATLVKIGEFRNKLSAFLKKVRQGEEVIISDRDTPLGRLIPFQKEKKAEPFDLIKPPLGYTGLGKVHLPKLHKKIDAVDELLRERRKS